MDDDYHSRRDLMQKHHCLFRDVYLGETTHDEIINKHLSRLTFNELNAADENGINLLHFAVRYSRVGKFWTAPGSGGYNRTGRRKDVVQWLLENESFYQKGTQGTWEYDTCNVLAISEQPSGTGLHLAFCSRVPHRVRFDCGDDGSRGGKSLVAGEALDSMIENEAFMHANVNALNE
jgi:hypothetical protein